MAKYFKADWSEYNPLPNSVQIIVPVPRKTHLKTMTDWRLPSL